MNEIVWETPVTCGCLQSRSQQIGTNSTVMAAQLAEGREDWGGEKTVDGWEGSRRRDRRRTQLTMVGGKGEGESMRAVRFWAGGGGLNSRRVVGKPNVTPLPPRRCVLCKWWTRVGSGRINRIFFLISGSGPIVWFLDAANSKNEIQIDALFQELALCFNCFSGWCVLWSKYRFFCLTFCSGIFLICI